MAFLALIALSAAGCGIAADLGESTTALTGATVSTNQPWYGKGQSITVSWTGTPGNSNDWVTIVPAGSPANSGFIKWYYTNGQVNGSQVFAGLNPGNYEARTYQGGTYTILASSTFGVTSISTNATTYVVGAPVTVSWTNMPTDPNAIIAVATAGAPPGTNVQSVTTGGVQTGSHSFTGLASGSYEARSYLSDGVTILSTSTFTISGTPAVTTDMATYNPGQAITVSWTNSPGASNDWVALAKAGAPANTVLTWVYTNGAVNGSHTFAGINAVGPYEARLYKAATYTILGTASFSVVGSGGGGACTPPTTPPVLGSLTSGDIVMSATQNKVTVAMTPSLTTSILFTSLNENEPSPSHGATMCYLHATNTTDPAGITCQRATAGTDSTSSTGVINIHWTVATFTSGVTVQRGVANTGLANPTTVALTTVDPTSSFVLLGGILTGGTGWGNNEFVRAQLTSGTSLDLRTVAAGSQVAWQVVTMTGAHVQRGTTAFTTSDFTKTPAITSVPTGSFVLASYTTDNASGVSAGILMLQSSLQNATSLLLKRDLSGTNLDVSWEVVSLPFAVHQGLTTFTAGQTTTSVSLTGGFTAASSVALSGSQSILGAATGSTTYAGTDVDLVGEAAASFVTGSNSLTVTRATSQAAAELPWSVIDFAHNCNGL